MQLPSDWVAAMTLVSPLEASSGANNYNYGFDSFLSRGMNAFYDQYWYSNMSVYSVSSISANTLSGISMVPFSFAGKQWDYSDDIAGVAVVLKLAGLVISFIMLKKLVAQHSVLVTNLAPQCKAGCPLLDGGFTDNSPITPVLSAASEAPAFLHPRQISILAPANTMQAIKYLMGIGSLGIWTAGGLNLCPFTQVSICKMITTMRELVVPSLPYEIGHQWRSISFMYQVHRPDQQVISPYCEDPLIFDHFAAMCLGDSICHMITNAVPGTATAIRFMPADFTFQLSMVWLAHTNIAARFVTTYIPDEMIEMQYYSDMKIWFPDFAAIAPQKGGIGFTKVAGHSVLDYLTYLVIRLTKTQTQIRVVAYAISKGNPPTCGYTIFEKTRQFTAVDEVNR